MSSNDPTPDLRARGAGNLPPMTVAGATIIFSIIANIAGLPGALSGTLSTVLIMGAVAVVLRVQDQPHRRTLPRVKPGPHQPH